MKTRIIVIAAVALLAVAGALAFGAVGPSTASDKVVVYKTPTCGCCGDWIEHMRGAGFEVEVHDLADLGPVKDQYGVGRTLRSCHTAKVGDYVLEGHVPADQVLRLLDERPDVDGLAVPGMPIGSPGMDEGYDRSTWQDYDVVAFSRNGETEVYAHIQANP
jgi:hypothetical protein